MKAPTICRYCGGVIRAVPAVQVYGASAGKLGLEHEHLYQCQNCNARVGCHKGTLRPLGNVANETLRLKRMETHQVFDNFWRSQHMSRTQAYKWLSQQMRLPEKQALPLQECTGRPRSESAFPLVPLIPLVLSDLLSVRMLDSVAFYASYSRT